MHFDNVFQFKIVLNMLEPVVIWCTLTMSFSSVLPSPTTGAVVIWCTLTMSFSRELFAEMRVVLWFDALWQCLSVHINFHHSMVCCDLMHFDNVFQSAFLKELKLEVVIWCTLTMSFSIPDISVSSHALWFDALWQCLSVLWMREERRT